MARTIAELDTIRDDCRRMVTQRSLVSAGVTAVPLPGVDLVADIGLLTSLLPAISARFGLREDQVKTMDPGRAQQVLAIAAGLGNNLIGRSISQRVIGALLRRVGKRIVAASVARYVPVLGTAVAAGISFGAMKLAGNAHIDDCYATVRAMLDDGATPSPEDRRR